jgi:hypothetical protein
MTSDEARLILQAVHAEGAEARDPKVQAALQLAARDPALAAWWAEERAFDDAVRRKLGQVPVPDGLAARLLKGEAAARRSPSPRRRAFLALAACLAGLLGLAAVWLSSSGNGGADDLDAFRDDMARLLRQFPQLDISAEKWADIDRWLAGKTSLNGTEIPGALRAYPGIGCRELRWRNHRVLLVCLAVRGEIVHVFLVPDGGLPGGARTMAPQFARVRGWNTAKWNDHQVSAAILTKADESSLRDWLRPRG